MGMFFLSSGTPDLYSPAYNPLPFSVGSTNSGQTNFQFLFDVYITGQSGYTRFKKPPDAGAGGRAFFDASQVIRDYLSKNIDKNDTAFKENTSSYVQYRLKVGEEYGVSSGVTQYADVLVDDLRYTWNGVFNQTDFNRYSQEDYIFRSGATSAKFLTSHPDSLKVRSTEYRWAYMITSGTNHIGYMRVRTYDSAGNLLQTCQISNDHATVSSGDEMFLRFPSGINMNQIPASKFLAGAQPVITASVSSFDICAFFWDGFTGARSSELRTYVIEDKCTPHDTYTFHFLNELGGYDTFTTIRKSEHDTKGEKKTFKRIVGGITSTNGWSYINADRGRINYNTTIRDTITVHSDWITEDEATWLEQLIYSPDVYLDDSTHNLISINILTDTFRRERQVNTKLINISFSFEYSYNRYRQTSI